ncbi:MAG TPA: hypothetical protein VE967_17130 [Gemmatimonadaceae bacterium]|nr:hypothetical protein [Gemmatimonadaceae bacterium]
MRPHTPTTRSLSLLIPLLLSACYPPFAEMQSARLTGQGHHEFTGYYSSSGGENNGSSQKLYNHVGLAWSTGVASNIDLRARVERVSVTGEYGDAYTALSFGPKFSLNKDHVALNVPVGFAISDGETSTWEVHPTLLFTAPVSKSFEFNPSAKLLLPLGGGSSTLMAVNVGAAIGTDVERWAIRPEVGFLFKPGDSGYAYHFGVGFSYRTGK